MSGGKRKTAINTKNSQILSAIHGVRREVELLLAAAGNYDEDHRKALIEDILKDEIDWDYFNQLTNHHRIWPLVYWNLNLADSKAISKQFLDHLKDQFNLTALRNLFLSQKMLELLELLKSNHIDAIPYKGSFLASEYYGNLALRQFGDIDILVKQKDILNVRAILIDSGFIPLDKLDKKNERIFSKREYHFRFNSCDGEFLVEVHWQLIQYPLQPPIEYIWESCINTKFFGTEVQVLPPEECLVILCLHGYKHYWARLKWLCDIALIIKSNPNLNWNHIKWCANNLGTEKSLYLGLYLAHFLLNAKLPKDIVQIIRRNKEIFLQGSLLCGRLFKQTFGLPGFNEWQTYLIAGMQKIKQRCSSSKSIYLLMYLRALSYPDFDDFCSLALPFRFSFIYYFYRLIRYTRRHKTHIFRLLR